VQVVANRLGWFDPHIAPDANQRLALETETEQIHQKDNDGSSNVDRRLSNEPHGDGVCHEDECDNTRIDRFPVDDTRETCENGECKVTKDDERRTDNPHP